MKSLVIFLLACAALLASGSREGDSLAIEALFNESIEEMGYSSMEEHPCLTIENDRVVSIYVGGSQLEPGYNISSIPSEIGNLTALSILHINVDYKIGTLPPEIGLLESLTTINIYGGIKTEGKDSWANFASLSSLPDEFYALPNLSSINFSYTRLGYNEFVRCKNMESNPSLNFYNVSPGKELLIEYSNDSSALQVINPMENMTYTWRSEGLDSVITEPVLTSNYILKGATLEERFECYCIPSSSEFSYYGNEGYKNQSLSLKGTRVLSYTDSLRYFLRVEMMSDSSGYILKNADLFRGLGGIQWNLQKSVTWEDRDGRYSGIIHTGDTFNVEKLYELKISEIQRLIDNNIDYDDPVADSEINYGDPVYYYIACPIRIKDQNYHWRSDNFQIGNWMKEQETSIEKSDLHSVENKGHISISNQGLVINSLVSEKAKVQLFNLMGQMIYSRNISIYNGQNHISLDNHVSRGNYIVQLKRPSGISSFKYSKY